jgi:shikimate dehydrogenase
MPRLAVLGHPVSHSRSPAMHTAALEDMGLAPEWSYEAIDVEPEGFEALVRKLPAQGFAGVNVTVPHKVAALTVSDEASEAAHGIGAANTLTFREDRIVADNTDAAAIVDALPESPAGMRALVLGAGGSARAAVWALREAGADVHVWNRTKTRAEGLAAEFGVGLDLGLHQILVNTTTVGLAQANEVETPPEQATPDLKAYAVLTDGIKAEVVIDLPYGSRDTELIAAARAQGVVAVDGLEILALQGAASLRIWTGREPSLELMREAARGAG